MKKSFTAKDFVGIPWRCKKQRDFQLYWSEKSVKKCWSSIYFSAPPAYVLLILNHIRTSPFPDQRSKLFVFVLLQ